MSASDSPPNHAEPRLPYEQAAARAAAGPAGGWTGFWVVFWSGLVGLHAALLAAALVLGHALLDVADLVVANFALEHDLPQHTLEDPTATLTDAASMLVAQIEIPVWTVTAICVALMVTGIRLTAGSEGGRKWSRLLLALLAGNLLAGAVYVWLTIVPTLASRAEELRAAITGLARALGEPVDRGVLDTLLDPAFTASVAWAPVLLVGGPTVLLWWAAGRRSLRTWCAQRQTTTAAN